MGRRAWSAVFAALCFLAAGFTWSVLADVAVHKTSVSGRIESTARARPIQAAVAGVVVVNRLAIGRRVSRGDVLLELDSTSQVLERKERQARLAALEAQETFLARSEANARALVDELSREGDLVVREAESAARSAHAEHRLAARDRRRQVKLTEQGLASRAELDRALTLHETRGASAASADVRIERLRANGRRQLEQGRLDFAKASEALAAARGELAAERTAIERLDFEIDRRRIRAPIAGVIGTIGEAREGSYLREGDTAAVLVPDGTLRAVALFNPLDVGPLAAGQAVTLRFPAYPWTAFGTRRGRLVAVANEPINGLIRVDIEVEREPGSRIPLQHGQEIVAEVTIETISPARLLLRNVGLLFEEQPEGTG
jgi:multidrug resistance efflux pump